MRARRHRGPARALPLATARLAAALVVAVLVAGCTAENAPPRMVVEVPGGDPARAPGVFMDYGCTSCHTIPGVRDANSRAAPPLTYWADRAFIAGRLPNTPENLILWIMSPQEVDPQNAMPDMGVPEAIARDMAAYLYTLGGERSHFRDRGRD